MSGRCSRSTATRSPTAPTTRCRSRSARRRRPAGLLVGFANLLVRLWEEEQPRGGARRLGHARPCRPTGTRRSRPTSRAASSTTRSLEQLDLLPALVESFGFAAAKARRLRGRRLPRRRRRARGGPGGKVLVATADRDAFQLVSDRVDDPPAAEGGGELARIGPAEVRERYGVEPEQVPDFIALRGDPSDKIPGARGRRAEEGGDVLKQHGSLEEALAAGRFAAEADELRLYRRIATMDAAAPSAAARATRSRLGPRRRARATSGGSGRLARAAGWRRCRAPDASRRSRALHPTGSHPESPGAAARALGGETRRAACRATEQIALRATTAATSSSCGAIDRPGAPGRGHGLHRDLAGRPRSSPPASRSRRSSAAGSRSCGRRATTRSPTGRWASASSTTSRSPRATRRPSSGSSGSRSSTSTSTTATARRRSSAATTPFSSSRCTSGRSIRARAGPARATRRRSTCRCPPAPATRDYLRGVRGRVEPAVPGSSPTCCSSRPASTRTRRIRSPRWSVTADGFRELAERCAALAPRVAAVLEGGYNLATLPALVAAAHEGFAS